MGLFLVWRSSNRTRNVGIESNYSLLGAKYLVQGRWWLRVTHAYRQKKGQTWQLHQTLVSAETTETGGSAGPGWVWLKPSLPLGLARLVPFAFWPKPDGRKLTLLGSTAAAPCVLKLPSSATGPGSSTAACTLPPWRLPGHPGCSLYMLLLPAPLPTPNPHPKGADQFFFFMQQSPPIPSSFR